jgi:eukaryotic-like serine/threonine-protein kinase
VGLMHTILFESPVPATRYRPDLPEALLRILERATAKDREQRYPDCHAFQSDLEEFIHSLGRPVTAQQVAQLIQRTTAGDGLPAQRPLPEVQLPSMAAPLPTRTGAPGAEVMTARDTQPDATPLPTTLSLTRRAPPVSFSGGRPWRVTLKRRLASSAWLSLSAGLFMLLGGAVVWKAGLLTPSVDDSIGGLGAAGVSAPSVQAPPPSESPVQPPPPSEPSPEAPSVQTPPPEETPVPKSPSTKPDTAKPRPRKAPSRRHEREAPPVVVPAPVPSGKASAFLDSRPYAYVSVDDKSLNDYTPIKNVSLSSGPHLLEFVEAESRTPRRLKHSLTLQPGQKVKVFANFDQGTVRVEEEE